MAMNYFLNNVSELIDVLKGRMEDLPPPDAVKDQGKRRAYADIIDLLENLHIGPNSTPFLDLKSPPYISELELAGSHRQMENHFYNEKEVQFMIEVHKHWLKEAGRFMPKEMTKDPGGRFPPGPVHEAIKCILMAKVIRKELQRIGRWPTILPVDDEG